jgi:hypothetical protein
VRLPPTQGRYFSLTLVDTAGAPFLCLGSRTGDDRGADIALVGPDWEGELPDGLTARRAPCASVWALSRLHAHSALDLRQTLELAGLHSLTPLQGEDQPARRSMATLEAPTPTGLRQAIEIDAVTFFHRLDSLIERAPTGWRRSSAASVAAARLEIDGAATDWGEARRQSLADGILDGSAAVRAAAAAWVDPRRASQDRIDDVDAIASPLERAARASLRLGAPAPEDILSFVRERDADDRSLTGTENYRIRFEPNALPPAQAFWRLLAVPGPDPHTRREISDRNDPSLASDGSLNVLVQSSPPDPAQLFNWLPPRDGGFRLVMRLYWPGQSALNGAWRMPAIERVTSPLDEPKPPRRGRTRDESRGEGAANAAEGDSPS